MARPTSVVTKYEIYASLVPSFSFRGFPTVTSSLPYSPMPAKSTASAPGLDIGSWLVLLVLSLALPRPGLSLGPAVFGREESLVGSLRHETLSKSSASIKNKCCVEQRFTEFRSGSNLCKAIKT